MSDLFQRRSVRPSLEELLPKVEHWFNGSVGQQMLVAQRQLINNNIHSCFGYHLLQLSVSSTVELYDESTILNKFRSHPLAHAHSGENTIVQADFESLPFATESVDAVILHHVHEFVTDPHELLREIQRVVIPGGKVIVVGFNPWSLMGCKALFSRFVPDSIWHNNLLSRGRVSDWLGVLGFAIQASHFGYHMPKVVESMHNPSIDRILKNWGFGDFYVLSAIKQVANLTPIKPKWRPAANNFGVLTPGESRVVRGNPTAIIQPTENYQEAD